ncbi:MAG: DUF3164 family protein [Bacteroidales bacterium]|nr:DUF3164 family protein [Bacteroidales bacterium]
MTKQNYDVTQMTEEELEELLKAKREHKRKEQQRKREHYEQYRDQMTTEMVKVAKDLHDKMKEFKRQCMENMEHLREEAKRYGEISAKSKGGFSLRNQETGDKVVYERNVKTEYDERADIAAGLIWDFLGDKVKKRSKEDFNMISGFLAKNNAGDFNPTMIGRLLANRNNYSDERWVKAMDLFEESHNTVLISMNISFMRKNSAGKDVAIPLTFSSIALDEEESNEKQAEEEKKAS